MNQFNYTPRKRRGLSSIVGALLFVVLMVAAFAVFGGALDTQTEIVDTGRVVADSGLKKQQEDFVITNVVQTPGNNFELYAKNNGQNPAEIFTVVMTNSSDSENGFPTTTFDIPSNTSFLAPGDENPTNIVETLDLKMKTPSSGQDTYQLKVISSLGTVKKFNIVCDSSGLCGQSIGGGEGSSGLDMQLFLDGPNGVNTKTSTVIMVVQNTGDLPLKDVYPDQACDAMVVSIVPDIAGTADFTGCDIEPLPDSSCGDGSGVCLAAGQTRIFRVDGTILGEIDDVFTFCNSVSGKELDDTPVTGSTDCDLLTVIDPNDCGGCGPGGESIILIDDLLIRPSIFMVIPAPFGDTQDNLDDTGLWGINVANPTDEDMSISKVTIVAYPPGGNSQDTVFNGQTSGADCLSNDIAPNLGAQPQGYWTCPRDNILMWQNFTNPLLLPANSTQSFMMRVEPSNIKTAGDNLDALIVQANVYSTFGSFGKAAYQSSMYEEKSPIVNVYLTNSTLANINNRDNFISNVNDIPENSTQTFNVVMADLDNQSDTFVNSGARLIINLPRDWVFDGFNDCDGFDENFGDGDCLDGNIPTAVVHNDDSTQIIGTTQVPIGDGVNDALRISFDAIAPDVIKPQLHVMYVLGDGVVTTATGGDKTIGPLNEVVINVDP